MYGRIRVWLMSLDAGHAQRLWAGGYPTTAWDCSERSRSPSHPLGGRGGTGNWGRWYWNRKWSVGLWHQWILLALHGIAPSGSFFHCYYQTWPVNETLGGPMWRFSPKPGSEAGEEKRLVSVVFGECCRSVHSNTGKPEGGFLTSNPEPWSECRLIVT